MTADAEVTDRYDVRAWTPDPPRATGRLRRRVRRIGANPTRHSSTVLRSTFPRAVSSLGRLGVLIGTDIDTGNSFAFDPFLLYGASGLDQLSNPNVVVAGAIGQGKSSLIKSYLARQSIFGRKVRIFSVKRGEYDTFAQLTGATVVRVTPGGRTVVNPLDAVYTGNPEDDDGVRPMRLGVLAALLETHLDRKLQADEATALGLALDQLGQAPTLPEVLDVFRDPPEWLPAELRLNPEQWADRFYTVTATLHNLCHGTYAGLFNGQTSPDMDLDADLVVYDLEPLSRAGDLALPLFMAVATARLHLTLARETSANIIVVYEEGWRALAHLGVVRFMQESWKLARSYGVSNMIVLHRASDFAGAGDEGKLATKLAMGLLSDTAVKVVYAPEAHEREATGRMLALSPDEVDALRDLQVGEALWRVDDRSARVQHVRSRLEIELFSTDDNMRRRGSAQPRLRVVT